MSCLPGSKKVDFTAGGSDSDDVVRVNPSELHRKKKQKTAMEDLVLKRKEKEGAQFVSDEISLLLF